MKTYANLYCQLCSIHNLERAFKKARKRKAKKDYVIEFEANLQANLASLGQDLQNFTYRPSPLTTFIVRDPKTRKISSSHFRDRVVHHALCNIISPILEKVFIYDSFANQNGKGTHKALRRAAFFMGKTARMHGSHMKGFALKADIRHYFDTVDHVILLKIISLKITDQKIIQLIRIILANHKSELEGKGMPIGNLTSQFFANVYLGELDQFIKHTLKAKHYIRYVDDFVIFDNNKKRLEKWQAEIDNFLRSRLAIELHKEKTKIVPLHTGITFLGFRIFRDYKLLKKSNARRIWKRLEIFRRRRNDGLMTNEDASRSLEGWLAYARFANTYNLRNSVTRKFSELLSKDDLPQRRTSDNEQWGNAATTVQEQ